jgi:ABC-type sugar transport system ATPase subunit
VVSHRLRDLIEHCDRIIVLHDGTASVDIIRGDLDWSEEALLRHLVRDQ